MLNDLDERFHVAVQSFWIHGNVSSKSKLMLVELMLALEGP